MDSLRLGGVTVSLEIGGVTCSVSSRQLCVCTYIQFPSLRTVPTEDFLILFFLSNKRKVAIRCLSHHHQSPAVWATSNILSRVMCIWSQVNVFSFCKDHVLVRWLPWHSKAVNCLKLFLESSSTSVNTFLPHYIYLVGSSIVRYLPSSLHSFGR